MVLGFCPIFVILKFALESVFFKRLVADLLAELFILNFKRGRINITFVGARFNYGQLLIRSVFFNFHEVLCQMSIEGVIDYRLRI